MTRYTPATPRDREEMLAAIGVATVEDLFADVPDGVRLGRPLDLPDGMAEQDVFEHLRALAARNVSTEDEVSFLGGGMYDHYVPALIDAIVERSEFLTPYTPYQPEVSQGGLQVMFEFQTAISELTGLPVANASVYEGPSAVGAAGADVAVGEGQPLGNRLDYGGPSFGFFAATEAHLRRMPGRIAGETHDVDGRRGFVLTLQTREQHIRREKATSNICTSQALNALAGVMYLGWLGRAGLVELGELLLQRTAYARDRLAELPGVALLHRAPVVREFAVTLDVGGLEGVRRVVQRCQDDGVNPGYALGADYPEHADGLLVAITERRTRADIDRLADVLGRAVAAERSGRSVGAAA